jgi:hypothetical protein
MPDEFSWKTDFKSDVPNLFLKLKALKNLPNLYDTSKQIIQATPFNVKLVVTCSQFSKAGFLKN